MTEKSARLDPARFDVPNATHRDGKALNGALHITMEVFCPGCEAFYGGLGHTTALAEAELRKHEWTKKGGLWRCPPCSDRIAS